MSGNPTDPNYNVPVAEQVHEVVYFLSGKFQHNQLGWHVSGMHGFYRSWGSALFFDFLDQPL